MSEYRQCSNCVMDTTDSNITFDENGVCNRCRQFYQDILPDWNYGRGHLPTLTKIVDKIKKVGKNKKYDCIIGLSGGIDSAYMLHYAVCELNLRPLVVHVDAGWDTELAKKNISLLANKLNIDIITEKINWDEMRDMQLAFFKAGVTHLDTPQDHAFVSVIDKYAIENNIKYVLNGGNISTEVIVNPNSWGYWGTDRKNINDILNKFGTVNMTSYPFTSILRRKLYVPYIKGIQTIKLLNLVPYKKYDVEKFLKEEYGFISYSQKHFESIMTKFIEGYWWFYRFQYDVRLPQFSSLILTGQIQRDDAIERLKLPPLSKSEEKLLFSQVSNMLEITEEELNSYFLMPKRTYKNYKNEEFLFTFGAKVLYMLGFDKLIRK